jgi:tRNA modification GTPase
MNVLLGQNRSIVTPIPGTTRDAIEEIANIRGIPVRLVDTAGIRDARGAVERIGVERSRNALQHSELVMYVLDASRPFSKGELPLAALCADKPRLVVCNKADLPRKLKLPHEWDHWRSVETSARTGDGIEILKDEIEAMIWEGAAGSTHVDVAVNERHAEAIRRAEQSLTSAVVSLRGGFGLEVVSQQLRISLDAIGEIVGKTATEDILSKIFSTFCIGK